MPAVEGPFAFPNRRVQNHEFRIGPATAVYQPVLKEILTGGYDAVVLSAEAKFIANTALALLAPLRGIAVLYWGFGYHPQRGFRDSDAAPQRRLFKRRQCAEGLALSPRRRLSRLYPDRRRKAGRGRLSARPRLCQRAQHDRRQRADRWLCDRVAAEDPAQIRRALGPQRPTRPCSPISAGWCSSNASIC